MIVEQTYTFKIVRGCEIQADVYSKSDGVIHPAIIWIHGGALITGHRKGINRYQLEMYISAGYTVVSIDYRLAPETKLKDIIEDIQDACRWVREEGSALFHIDPERIVVMGHSAGGYLTLMAGFCVEPRPRTLISFYGYGDIAGNWLVRPDAFYCQQPPVSKREAYAAVNGSVISGASIPNNRGRFYLYCRQNGLWPKEVTGHDPDTEPAAFDPFCPIRNITTEYPATLLLHGTMDTDVPYDQSMIMAYKLACVGVEHELVTIPDGGHGFDAAGIKNPLASMAFERVFHFLKQHV